MALRLAAAGYYGGDVERVLAARGDLVLAALQYEVFKGEYEDVFVELNKNGD